MTTATIAVRLHADCDAIAARVVSATTSGRNCVHAAIASNNAPTTAQKRRVIDAQTRAAELWFSRCTQRFKLIPNRFQFPGTHVGAPAIWLNVRGRLNLGGRTPSGSSPAETDDCCGGSWGGRSPNGLMRTITRPWKRSSRPVHSGTRFPKAADARRRAGGRSPHQGCLRSEPPRRVGGRRGSRAVGRGRVEHRRRPDGAARALRALGGPVAPNSAARTTTDRSDGRPAGAASTAPAPAIGQPVRGSGHVRRERPGVHGDRRRGQQSVTAERRLHADRDPDRGRDGLPPSRPSGRRRATHDDHAPRRQRPRRRRPPPHRRRPRPRIPVSSASGGAAPVGGGGSSSTVGAVTGTGSRPAPAAGPAAPARPATPAQRRRHRHGTGDGGGHGTAAATRQRLASGTGTGDGYGRQRRGVTADGTRRRAMARRRLDTPRPRHEVLPLSVGRGSSPTGGTGAYEAGASAGKHADAGAVASRHKRGQP